MITNDVSDYYL